jgi:GMP synthase (glutamine-hydrolysing)
MFSHLRYLLLQIRDADDPMREQEVECFVRALGTRSALVEPFDLLNFSPSQSLLDRTDVVLIGGSGRYSATDNGKWLARVLDALRELHAQRQPTFASCWGFQAMARAMGGQVIHDLDRAEIGTHEIFLTPEGADDPVFSSLSQPFYGQMGHEDRVLELPPDTTRLAYTKQVENQAYRFDGLPIYCTQFHPELNEQDLLRRVRVYPEYIERIAGMPPELFEEIIHPTPETEELLLRFVEHVFG